MSYSYETSRTAPIPVTPPVGPPAARGRSQLLPWIVVTVLVLALGLLAYLYTESLDSGRKWKSLADATSRELTTVRTNLDATKATLRETESDLTAARSNITKLKGDLSATTTKYNDAADRIRSLADEKAQAGDRVGVLATIVQEADGVAGKLDQCVTGLQGLQGYLVNAAAYDTESLTALVTEVNSFCDEAQSDMEQLQQTLDGQS